MKIKVSSVGIIRKYFSDYELETEGDITPRQLINDLGIPVNGKIKRWG